MTGDGSSWKFVSLGLFARCRLRSRNAAVNRARKPSAPSGTATPIPIFVAVDNVLDGVLEGGVAMAGVITVDGAIAVGVVVVVGNVFTGLGAFDVELVTAMSMFHPATAIAPTVELSLRVVVTIDQSVERLSGVDAYVNMSLEDTSDKQSPPN